MQLTSRELATVLAALRLYQKADLDDEPDINDIATDGWTIDALNVAEIDSLCERINVVEADASEARKKLADCLNKCACCESTNIAAERLDCEGFEAWCVVRCNDCNSKWNEVYEFTRIDDIKDNRE